MEEKGMNKKFFLVFAAAVILIGGLLTGCAGEKVKVTPGTVAEKQGLGLADKLDPADWGKVFPKQYATYLLTEEGGSDHSVYRGSDHFDRNSAWPFQWVLYDGWGMGKEYTESRGHVHALIDQLEINSARRGAGGVCLSCKTPSVPSLKEKLGIDYFRKSYDEVYAQIPVQYNKLGVSCIDCHDGNTGDLRLSRWTLTTALDNMGNVPAEFNKKQMGLLTCGQCHVTYSIPKDENNKSVDLIFPWYRADWNNITIEAIEQQIKEDGLYEWTHGVTGIKLGHIRHPEFELFTNNSFHYNMGVTCVDCHMPAVDVDGEKVKTHQWTSPFKQGLEACSSCHQQSPEELKQRVVNIQDQVNELFTEAGYKAAQAAKAIEFANNTPGADATLLAEAKIAYEKSYYRIVFIGAENSMGFHNPPEAFRVLNDGLKYAAEADEKARAAVKKAGVTPPAEFDLELHKYPYDPAENRSFNDREK